MKIIYRYEFSANSICYCKVKGFHIKLSIGCSLINRSLIFRKRKGIKKHVNVSSPRIKVKSGEMEMRDDLVTHIASR
jgi:glutathionyl-hydroquinone reductase